jgi:hypothetical protein
MFVLGLLLILAGAVGVLSAVFSSSGTATFLGQDLSALAIFLLGVGSAMAVLWGLGIARFGAKRSMQHRRESKKLQELSDKLDKADDERRKDIDDNNAI